MIANEDDDQGLWDRVVFVTSGQDFEASDEINNPFEDLKPEEDFDVFTYLSIINREHQIPRTYILNKDAKEEILKVRKKLQDIVEHGHRGLVIYIFLQIIRYVAGVKLLVWLPKQTLMYSSYLQYFAAQGRRSMPCSQIM